MLPLMALLATWFAPMCVAQTVHRKPLTTATAILHLSQKMAQSGYPVRFRGQITYVDLEWDMMFLRGATGTVFVVLPKQTDNLHGGDVVLVEGITGTAPAGNYVQHIRFQVLSRKSLPAPIPVGLASLSKGVGESQYVAAQGILRPNQFLWDHTHLQLVDGHTSIPIVIPGGVNTAPLRFVGNRVVVQGVAGARTNAKGERVGAVLYLQKVKAIQPAGPAWQNYLQMPVSLIASLRNMDLNQRFLPAVHLRGKVLWHAPRKFVLVDRSGTIFVRTPSSTKVKTGDQLDVVGFPVVANGIDKLQDAFIRNRGYHPQSAQHTEYWSLAQALHHGKNGDSVTMSGILVAESARNGTYRFKISDHGRTFDTLAAAHHGDGQFLTIKPGSRVQATGTLRLMHYRDHRRDSIQLLVNSPNNIVVASSSGMNWIEFLSLLGGCILLGVFAWMAQMRRTLHAKTALLRAQMVQEAQLEDKYRRLFERSPAAIFVWRPSGEITDCNPTFARMMGFASPAEIIGRSYWTLLTESGKQPAQLTANLETGAISGRESSLRHRNGRAVHLLENVTRLEKGNSQLYETTALDITQSRLDRLELQRAKMIAQREAEIDALTGLSNRRRFSQATKHQLELAAEQQMPLALLFLDLDGFKAINDTLGHLIGDMLLQQVAERLKNQLPPGEMLSRVGGDEFAVLLKAKANVANPEHVAAAMLHSLAIPFRMAGHELTVGSSIGISLFPELASDYTSLLQQADSAMYAAKQSGRNRIIRYNDDIGQTLKEKNRLITELKRAVARREILLHYQPEFNRVSRQIVRFEALARWNSSILGVVPPIKFIAAAEECGLITELGRYLLEQACSTAVEWQQQTGQPIPVAVNISFLQLRTEGFVEMVFDILQQTGLPSTSLELEMTESIMLGEFKQCREVLTHLRTAGVKLALDDFGIGYSSLSYLPELPFDRLKIDRSFLQKANRGRDGKTLIEAVISIAHKLGMSVVVEGIETLNELDFVSSLGADEVQGYFLGSPGPDPCVVIANHSAAPLKTKHANAEATATLLLSPSLDIAET